jgi:beta-glucanase (GH16 family)
MKFLTIILVLLTLNLSWGDNMAKWILIWSDEFNYNGLPDPSKWNFETEGNAWGWGNGEEQFYTDSRTQNAIVEDGILKIIALKERMEGKEYTSARINTKGKGEWLYGRFEAKIKLPSGRGIWPAFWMMPAKNFYGPWPKSGEIDIMEMFGWYNPYNVYSTIHTEKFNHKIGTHKQGFYYDPKIHSEFNIYAVEWFEDRLDFYFNTNKIFTYRKEASDSSLWPFDKPFYIILNNAVGGDWCRQHGGVGNTIFPQVLYVDYVRVYKLDDGKPKSIDIKINGKGKVKSNINTNNLKFGEDVVLTAMPEEGYRFVGWYGDLYSKSETIKFKIYQNTRILANFVPVDEIIDNGNFIAGLSEWEYWVDNNYGGADFKLLNDGLEINIWKKAKYDWQIQLTTPIELEKEYKYVLNFKAYSKSGKFILRAGFNQRKEPWKSYYSKKFEIDKESKECSLEFLMQEENDPYCRVEFDFGEYTGKIIIESVSVKKIKI